jgi:hypothetical protein
MACCQVRHAAAYTIHEFVTKGQKRFVRNDSDCSAAESGPLSGSREMKAIDKQPNFILFGKV